MTILIDDREGSQDLAQIEPIRSMDHCLCRLSSDNESSADVAFSGNGPSGSLMIGIELKSIDDLISSSRNNRLQATQIPQMIQDGYAVRWLLHYGEYRPSLKLYRTSKGKCFNAIEIYREATSTRRAGWYTHKINDEPVMYSTIHAFLAGPALYSAGFQSMRVNTLHEAAVWIATLYSTWQKEYADHKSLRCLDQSQDPASRYRRESSELFEVGLRDTSDPKLQTRIKYAALANGFGYEKALALARHFQSVRDMINASPDEIAEITTTSVRGQQRKIGKVLAKSREESLT